MQGFDDAGGWFTALAGVSGLLAGVGLAGAWAARHRGQWARSAEEAHRAATEADGAAADLRRERSELVERLRESDERQMALVQRIDSLEVAAAHQREALAAWQGRGAQAEGRLSLLEPMMAQLRDEVARAKRREVELEALLQGRERRGEPGPGPGGAGQAG